MWADGVEIPVGWLSEGQVAYLGFVALSMLPDNASIIAFDEVETHLHPALLIRVLELFRSVAAERPVLLATHSDALLDGLGDQAVDAAVLAVLDEKRRTQLYFPDRQHLSRFMNDFRGLGDIRARGYGLDVLSSSSRSGPK